MIAPQSSTIPIGGLEPLAEMEDEERSSLASSIKRNSGGGQKRKRKEQEEDPNFLQIVGSRRLVMLESIVCVLKCFNSVLRFQVPADGDLGFRLETGSLEEQRIAGLIYSHVCSYILLYHLEKKTTNDSISSDEIIKLVGSDDVLPERGEIDDLVWGVDLLNRFVIKPPVEARRALLDDPTRNGNIGSMEYSSTYDTLRDYNKDIRKQELMVVIHTLEMIGRARGYAPPEDDEEILCYKEIRKQITCYILHVQARPEVLAATGDKDATLRDPFCCPQEPEALCFIPPMHQLEVSFEQMPEHLALLKECKQRVTQLLSSGPTPMSDRIRDLVVIMQAKDAALSALLSWKPKKESCVKTRSDCLDRIIDILRRIRSFGEQTPTEKEIRMYAQIGEHVRSSIWLCHSIEISQHKDKRSCGVYFANVFTDRDHSSLSTPDAQGKHMCTREQLLEQIMAYLRAFKSSCVDDVPSCEEEGKYYAIWKMIYPGLLVCLHSRPIPPVDEEPEEISGLELPELERKLCYIYKRVRCFLEEVTEEIRSMAAVVHRALLPEEQLSPEGALNWFMTCEDDAATKAKEFVNRSLSLGSMANLEQALQMLVEWGDTALFFFKLSDAVEFVDQAWHDGKRYAMVASEVENAFDIIRIEKPLVK